MREPTTRRAREVVAAATLLATTLWSPAVGAAPNPWPFDFDPEIAADPAGIEAGLGELGAGLPGLRDEELTEVPLGPVTLYMLTSLAEELERAVDSGPGLEPEVVRTPVICAAHEAFGYPSLLVSSPSAECVAAEATLAPAFADNASTCREVEFPETYVLAHPPGHVDRSVVRSLEGLIAVAGEALSHLDYPAGLLQEDFFEALRPIIAKIRYETLTEQLDARREAYAGALETLSSSAVCFQPGPRGALEETIDDLTAELDAAQGELDRIHADGLAQAAADRAAARTDCRARADLPYPALSDGERILLAHYLGGIFWRARGAGLLAYPPDPDMGLLRRMLYVGDAFQVLAHVAGGEGGNGVGANILIDENWGWDEWWDMGTTPGSADKYSDLVGMTKRGKRGVSLARPQIEGRGYDIRSLVGGAMMMGPCYYYAWELLPGFRLGEDLEDPYMWFIEWPTSIGEYCAGAALAEGLARTLLWGTTIPPEECVEEPVCPDGGCVDGGADSGADGGTDGGTDGGADGGVIPVGDGGADPDDPDESGCSCTAAGGGAAGCLWLFVAALLFKGTVGRTGCW